MLLPPVVLKVAHTKNASAIMCVWPEVLALEISFSRRGIIFTLQSACCEAFVSKNCSTDAFTCNSCHNFVFAAKGPALGHHTVESIYFKKYLAEETANLTNWLEELLTVNFTPLQAQLYSITMGEVLEELQDTLDYAIAVEERSSRLKIENSKTVKNICDEAIEAFSAFA